VQLNELPLTPNGKVDRKALPAPTLADYKTDREYVAPGDKVERKLAALWEEALNVRPVGAKDNFFELGGTSLAAARLFLGISRKFGKDLPQSTLLHADTVELLANEIRSALKKTRHPTTVALRQSGSKPPFFVTTAAGEVLFLRPLAARMSDRPLYGFVPDGLDGMYMRPQTVEQLAVCYLSEMRKIQPVGPYFLGGYCFGGLVAFEMAQQLLRQGEKAAAVVLLSAPIEHPHWSYPSGVPEAPSKSFSGLRLGRLILTPRRILRLRWPMHRLTFALGLRIPLEKRKEYLGRAIFRAEHLYIPKPYPGTLICFHGSNLTEFGPDLGWQAFATRLEHHVIGDGDFSCRRDLFYEPLVEQTARELNACLDAAMGEWVAAGQTHT
jgi:thioesterase domain-containing protein/acyl carrier protein